MIRLDLPSSPNCNGLPPMAEDVVDMLVLVVDASDL